MKKKFKDAAVIEYERTRNMVGTLFAAGWLGLSSLVYAGMWFSGNSHYKDVKAKVAALSLQFNEEGWQPKFPEGNLLDKERKNFLSFQASTLVNRYYRNLEKNPDGSYKPLVIEAHPDYQSHVTKEFNELGENVVDLGKERYTLSLCPVLGLTIFYIWLGGVPLSVYLDNRNPGRGYKAS